MSLESLDTLSKNVRLLELDTNSYLYLQGTKSKEYFHVLTGNVMIFHQYKVCQSLVLPRSPERLR